MIPIVRILSPDLVDVDIPLGDGSTFTFCMDIEELQAFINNLQDAEKKLQPWQGE